MNRFEWMNAQTVPQAAEAATTTVADAMTWRPGELLMENAVVLKAGGLDLLDLMKGNLVNPHRLVNLRSAAGLDKIVVEKNGTLRIGALVTLGRLAENPIVRQRYTALAEAAGTSASPQIRNVATLGGNLLQRPRCWYFRSSHYHCARKGGEVCFAFDGENQYHAIFDHQGCAIVHPSTVATALVALGARIELVTALDSKREVLLEKFFQLPEVDIHRENGLKPGEILTAIVLLPMAATVRSVHLKQGEKDSFDWPIADVAVALDLTRNGVCKNASIVLGAAAPVPHRAKAAEAALVGKEVNGETAHVAGHAAVADAVPLTGNAFKLPIFEALVRRAVLAAKGGA